MIKTTIHIIFFFLINTFLIGQDDPVLFTVGDSEVRLSEFNYIYSKNNGKEANFSKESIEEYLNLYTNFKLKVAEARAKKIDTLTSYIEELAGYRRQLADSYIVEKELSKQVAQEAYERMKKDISFRHIQVNLPQKSSPAKERAAREKIEKAKEALKSGKPFETVVQEYSEDKRSISNGGYLGYITAVLPDGYYNLESALYNTPVGKTSDIVRSNIGFHIVKIEDHRPARGTMKAAHILIRKKYKGVNNPEAEKEAQAIYQSLKKGESFKSMVVQKTQDNNTKHTNGELGEFGIGKYETKFEDAAFGLQKDGEISEPVESSLGFHIILRISKSEIGNFESNLKNLIKKTKQKDRQEAGKKRLNEETKIEADHVCNDDVLDSFASTLDASFYEFRWKSPPINNKVLCTFGGQQFMLSEFSKFCKSQGRKRMQYSTELPPKTAVKELYEMFIDEKSIDYQQDRLEDKYIDFRNLMREYEEGILLFEVTKEEVWDKASNDENGINAYYAAHKNEYFWKERAEVEEYAIRSTDQSIISKILKKAGKQDGEKVKEHFNKDKDAELVMYTDKIYEQDDEEMKSLKWNRGSFTAPNINNALKMTAFKKVKRIIPSSQKTLEDARGFVISDYQLELEKQWISELKQKYNVTVNDKILKKLIR